MYTPGIDPQPAVLPSDFERVTAADLRPGDRFAETRNGTVYEVESIGTVGPSSRWINLTRGGRIRPRHTKKLWRLRLVGTDGHVIGAGRQYIAEFGDELTAVEPEVEEAIVSYHADEEPVEEGTSIQRPIISAEQVAREVHEEMLRAVMEGRA